MEKDFHYCVIKVLAQKSGFTSQDAQTIAYASQFVDDAIAHKALNIENPPAIEGLRFDENGWFEPICTAHKGIQFLSGLNKNIQRKIYIPFHFIPANPYTGGSTYDYTTVPAGNLAKGLVEQALALLTLTRDNFDSQERQYALIRLGVALHSYADTWSHQRFSGRKSDHDNDIERVAVWENDQWDEWNLFKKLAFNSLPNIGHAEASTLPDLSHVSWKYEHDASNIEYKCDNTRYFLEAAENILSLLTAHNGTPSPWKTIFTPLKACLSLPADSMRQKFGEYIQQFGDINFEYDDKEWVRKAITGGSVNFANFDQNNYQNQNYSFNGGFDWFLFHKASMVQREFILKNIKSDLL